MLDGPLVNSWAAEHDPEIVAEAEACWDPLRVVPSSGSEQMVGFDLPGIGLGINAERLSGPKSEITGREERPRGSRPRRSSARTRTSLN